MIFEILGKDDRSSCSDDSGSDVFRSVPRNRTAFLVWKIEGLRAVSVPRNKMGIFLSESAYIIYAVSSKDGPLPYPGVPVKEVKPNNSVRAIHFWIGSSCDSTISGGAALRAAELDSQVSASVLSRESEGRETARLSSYFRREFVVERNHFESPSCTLHRVTGLSFPVLTELEGVEWSNFASRDVILLDTKAGGVLFLWLGSSSSELHKRHGATVVESRRENNNYRVVVVEDGYEKTIGKEDRKLFESYLEPGSRSVLPEVGKVEIFPSPIKLYKCCEHSGKYKVAEIKSGPIFRRDLTSDSVYLLDRGEAGVWAWVGRQVDAREQLEAVRNARGFVKKKGYSPGVPVARALEGEEPSEMKTLIKLWDTTRNRPLTLPANFEPDYMTERPRMAAECQLLDDGSGDKTLWRICPKNGLLETEDRGIYYAGVCYVMCYKYGQGRRRRTVIYCWEGAHSSGIDRETALEAACRLAEETDAQLVKASQGREPPHLLQIYGGKLRILAGQHQDFPPKKYLVRVFGSTPYTSKALERPLRSSSLDSGGVFILFSTSPYVWCGGRSTGDAREASRRLAPSTAPLVAEGKEHDDFWQQIGGRGNYGTESKEDEEESQRHLYECRVTDGTFNGEEILGFTQSSLLPESSWILDAGRVVWIWLGKNSSMKTYRECVDAGTKFLYGHPAGRDRNTEISVIKQSHEPPTFIGLFENWNHNNLRDYRSFEAFRRSFDDQRNHDNLLPQMKAKISNFDSHLKYPLRILKNEPENLPPGVDVSRKEIHLTYDDFVATFKMNPDEFDKLPEWRRQRLKQAAGLF
ncbi:villin-1 isoform X2 [Venturia canescens]|uniref:villin-1 isoform X2 n=1 Tax=Venturia canescens TaxID=32260 RepID=UPI001C9D4F85|nr:villin-1 isoform X2 [Venturia canescens]